MNFRNQEYSDGFMLGRNTFQEIFRRRGVLSLRFLQIQEYEVAFSSCDKASPLEQGFADGFHEMMKRWQYQKPSQYKAYRKWSRENPSKWKSLQEAQAITQIECDRMYLIRG